MSIELILYLIDVAESLNVVLGLVCTLSIIGLGIAGIISFMSSDIDERDKKWDKYKLFINKYFWKFMIILFLACIIPCKKTMYLMLGAHAIKSSPLPSKIEQAIEKRIDKYLLEEEKKENK
jgi:hypothetical protein